MTSAINFTSINENFPVAGQDNDTQVFRDNFDTIKRSLQSAQEEITDLQANTAKLNLTNDFEKNTIERAVFQNCRDQKFDGGLIESNLTIDFENGPYQIFRFKTNSNVDFLNLPGDPALADETVPIGVGKITLELYKNGSDPSKTVSFITSGGTIYKKDPSFPETITLTSNDNPVFIEVWRHSSSVIFLRYLGLYS